MLRETGHANCFLIPSYPHGQQQAEADLTAARGALRNMTAKYADPLMPAVLEAQAAYDNALEALRATCARITFEAIPLHEWEAIVADCPPSAKQMEKHAAEVEKALKGN